MTQQDWSDDKLIEIWLTANEEPISEAERAELNRLIVAKPHLRERLIHLAQEQSWLMWHGAELESESSTLTVQPATKALQAWAEPSVDSRRSRIFRSARLRALAGGVAVGILATLAVLYWPTRRSDVAKSEPAKWPLKSSVLRIESGSATLDLPQVGHVVLEGPTELEMLDPMRARLKQGRIRVRATEATGFVVEYPDGKVTDLGTEFGLDVPPPRSSKEKTSLIVFDGAVDLERTVTGKQAAGFAPAERLLRGEGVSFRSSGDLDRIMSVVTGNVATFKSGSDSLAGPPDAVIVDVADNLHSSDTRKFYEIIPGGFGEDALAYVDRPAHEWNGITKKGMPRELIGADYVKTFSDDDMRTDVEIHVTISRPAKLYVFFDTSLEPPGWLRAGFHKTKEKIGMDLGPWPTVGRRVETAGGPGKSIDHEFTVWVRTVKEPGVVTLGANRVRKDPYMYGIAAAALDAQRPAARADNKPAVDKAVKAETGSHDAL